MPVLELSHICHSYGNLAVLQDVSVTLEREQSLAVVSPSGSGKSTLLSIAGLLLEPTSGEIAIEGMPVAGCSDAELAALRGRTFGFLFQHNQLVGSLRAIENVMVPALFAKLSPGEREEKRSRAERLLKAFGLEGRMDYFPFQLSGGQKRRVMVARALLMNPNVLIADEPTNDMDAASANSVVKALFDYTEQGGSLLLATHDPALAQKASHVYRLAEKPAG